MLISRGCNMKDKKTPILQNELNIEDSLKQMSLGHSKLLYWMVLSCLLVLQVVNLFAISNIKELIVAIVSLILLPVLLNKKGRIWEWISGLYVTLLMVCLIATAFTNVPFFGVFSAKRLDPEKYYACFAGGLYELSIGNYEESLSEFKKIKGIVPEDEVVDYYMWYITASVWAHKPDLCTQLSKELQEKILEPNEREREILFQFIPIINLVNTYNEDKFDQLMKELEPYKKANEQIFLLFELVAMSRIDNMLFDDEIIPKLETVQQGVDTFENFGYVKRSLWNALFIDFWAAEKYDYTLIALAELYSLDPAKFFEDYIWEHPLSYNPLNARWISLDNLAMMKNLFHAGMDDLKQSKYELTWGTKEKINNLGLFLGVPMAISDTMDTTDLYSILSNYTESAQIYNIVQVTDKTYLFAILENEFTSEDETALSKVANRADFYLVDINEQIVIEPLRIHGDPFQVEVTMDKLMIVQDTGTPKKFLLTQISGTGEYLYLFVLDLEEMTVSSLPLGAIYYHTGDFSYNPDVQTCSWSFQINNNYDANIQEKVGGTATAKLDLERARMDVETFYADPSLQLYVKERNEQLIFPLATLNRLGGKEIKDQVFLGLIRNNSKPYYNYSTIQYTYGYMAGCYVSDVSGIAITYLDEENMKGQAQNYFFLTKRVNDEIELLGIYNIKGNKLKSVY